MNFKWLLSGRFALCCWLMVIGSAAQAQSPSRGELLYTTHCGACHGTQMHWREKKLATTWDTLKAQVRRWQGVARLEWGEAEVEDVARYLNETIYRYPEPARVGLLVVAPARPF
jgi:mono/diheme cytochrome c family protein